MPDYIPVLSDHAYVSAHFILINHETGEVEVELNVGTYNMLDQGFSIESHHEHAYSNNAYNADESEMNYEWRKSSQFRMLASYIYHQGDDVILLQEIDFLLKPDKFHLREEFLKILHFYGYGLIITEKASDGVHAQQPMALIYAIPKLEFRESKGVFPTLSNGREKYRGYEATFVYRATNKLVSITNLHLVFGHDYNTEIAEHMRNQEQTGNLHIMGGDLNGILNPTSYTKLCDWNIATNFSRDLETGKLTICHSFNEELNQMQPKAYDRFLGVGPEHCSLFAELTQRSCKVFINENDEAVFVPVNRDFTYVPIMTRWEKRFGFFKPSKLSSILRDHFQEDLTNLEAFLTRIGRCDSEEGLFSEMHMIRSSLDFKNLARRGMAANILSNFIHTDHIRTFDERCEEKRRELISSRAVMR